MAKESSCGHLCDRPCQGEVGSTYWWQPSAQYYTPKPPVVLIPNVLPELYSSTLLPTDEGACDFEDHPERMLHEGKGCSHGRDSSGLEMGSGEDDRSLPVTGGGFNVESSTRTQAWSTLSSCSRRPWHLWGSLDKAMAVD